MCGKNDTELKVMVNGVGSPPRVREKSVGGSFMGCCDRITPACAGKIPAYRLSPHNFQDHPRVCGKNVAVYYFCYGVVGSPPRVREKSIISFCHCPNYRITPACAGKIHNFISTYAVIWDHPRVCGKNTNRFLIFKHSYLTFSKNLFIFLEISKVIFASSIALCFCFLFIP